MIGLSRAAIIAVGSELLSPARVDTNSLIITERLNAIGISVVVKLVVGDDRAELDPAVRYAMALADVVVCTGGLGPTDDDVTREVVAAVLSVPMTEDAAITDRIRARFASRGMEMPEINRRQAMVPRGAIVLENDAGSAPGLWLEASGRVIVLLPGPPRELIPMLDRLIDRALGERAAGHVLVRRVVRLTGRTESHADEALRPLYEAWSTRAHPVTATILAALGQIELHLSVRASNRATADAAVSEAVADAQRVLGADVYSVDGSPLEVVVGSLLADRGFRIAVAESCTGGLVTSRLTDVPGSSRYVEQAVVAYANSAKTSALDVSENLLARHGAVSEEVAMAMAEGVRARAGASVGLGITGIAGPDGGSADKPVGTVAIGLITPKGRRSRTFRFVGGRDMVKFQASQAALDMVRRTLLA